MHAVIRTGGKQYYVTAGDIVEVDKLAGNIGETIALTDVLMIAGNGNVTVGQPVVEGATVSAKITGQYRGQKIMVFRYRPKKRIRVRKGHRQYLTRLHVQGIRLADGTEFQIAAPEPYVADVVVEEPVVVAPVAEETIVEESVIEEPVVAESAVEESAADDTIVESGENDSAATAKAEDKE